MTSENVERLRKIGEEVVKEVKAEEVPYLRIPSRTTSNIVYDEDARCYVLGNKKKERTAGNIRHVKKLAQLLKVSTHCKNLIQGGKRHNTLRELYYISESWGKKLQFKEQPRSNDIVEDIEATAGIPREKFKIIPNPDGSLYGDITIRYKTPTGKKKDVNCLDTPDGQTIGPRISEAEIVECNADKVIAIETGGMYNRLMEENAVEKFNTLLVDLGGQASRATRRIIKRLHKLLDIPVYLFVDSDPWGLHCAMVVMAGSAKSAHINTQIATPDAEWLGVTASDIKKHNLKSDKLNDKDFKRIKELKEDPRYANDKRMIKELKLWEELGKKSEQQALLKYGHKYIVKEYLPAKFKELNAPGFS